MRLTRRVVLQGFAGALASVASLGTYAMAIEPRWRLVTTRYALDLPRWPKDLPLTIGFVSDIHACEPHTTLERIADIVERTNALKPDIILLGGDFVASHRFIIKGYAAEDWGPILGRLSAPLGVHSVLGNHDWWHGPAPWLPPDGARGVAKVLRDNGIAVLENDAVPLTWHGRRFWLAGLGDQLARRRNGRVIGGIDDIDGTIAKITDDAPALLMAHEPDIFLRRPRDRFALTLSGHTHGGQIRIFGYAPVVPGSYGKRLAYGHITDGDRHLLVNGGIGCSIAPVRFMSPPEIVSIRLGGGVPAPAEPKPTAVSAR